MCWLKYKYSAQAAPGTELLQELPLGCCGHRELLAVLSLPRAGGAAGALQLTESTSVTALYTIHGSPPHHPSCHADFYIFIALSFWTYCLIRFINLEDKSNHAETNSFSTFVT